jgi:type II secretory pathway pseudopilin PulG
MQAPDGSARRHGERGFALLEILVAFVILALGLGAISTGIAAAMRSDSRTQASRVVFRLAQSRLEAAGVAEALVPGHREGRIANQYKWQETVTAVHIGAQPRELRGVKPDPTMANAGVAPFWVEIAVQAADGTVARLAALKLAAETKR